MKLSEYKGEKVLIKEMEFFNEDGTIFGGEEQVMTTKKAIQYVGIRKMFNMPGPNAFALDDNNNQGEKFDVMDIEPDLSLIHPVIKKVSKKLHLK